MWRPTVAWVLEGRGELLGRDPRHATLVLGFLSCSHRRLRLTLRMSRPETGGGGQGNGKYAIGYSCQPAIHRHQREREERRD